MKLRHPLHFSVRKEFSEYTKTYELEYEDKNSSVIMLSRKLLHPLVKYGYKLWAYQIWISYGKLNKYNYQMTEYSCQKRFISYKEAKTLFNKLLQTDYKNLENALHSTR